MRVGILGGGQLGRMLAEDAQRIGIDVLVIDPQAGCSASQVAPTLTAAYESPEVARALEDCDVVTYEFEGVPLETCRALEAKMPLHPSTRALEVVRDRLLEKSFLRDHDIATADFEPVSNLEELERAVESVGLPAILKTRSDGYDGKGQWRLHGPDDLAPAARELGDRPAILEAFVPFDRELSLVAVCDADGAIEMWAPPENAHVGGILRISRAPAAGLTDAQLATGREWLARICGALDYRGVIAIELFEVDGRWLVNEMACRVHNSGHWTLDGAQTSQFENHMRAVAGWPIESTALDGSSAMLNLIGTLPPAGAVESVEGAKLYDYGKAPRPLRKIGHVNVRREDDAARDRAISDLVAAIGDADLAEADRPRALSPR